MIQATLCFVFREKPEPAVLLGYKKRGFGVGKYDGFGGKLQDGETLTQAALRELLEESGLIVEPHNLIPFGQIKFVFPYKPIWDQEVHLFSAWEWCGTPAESEEMRPHWFSIDSLPFSQMWDDSHYWMPYLLQNQSINASFVLDRDNETVKDFSIQLL